MFQGNSLSSRTFEGRYETDTLTPGKLYDYELAGVELNDGSQGLEVQQWICWVNRQGQVRMKPLDEVGDGRLIFTQLGIERLSFSFDRNMQPAVAYEIAGEVRFRWFDSSVAGYTTSVYPRGRTPRLTHDDKRIYAGDRSDVILLYMVDDKLIYRLQRDRYITEYVLREGLPHTLRLVQMGMNNRFRVQIEAR